MMPTRSQMIALVVGLAVTGTAVAGDGVLTLATTTSVEDSGLLAHLLPGFEAETGIAVKVIARGTGASLQLARDGNADAVLVHARAQEDAFVAAGYGVNRRDVMVNDFVILGPADDPAGVHGLRSAPAAFARIATAGAVFVSRGDASGTHIREQEIWRQSGRTLHVENLEMVAGGRTRTFTTVRPGGLWYRSIGQGMGEAITHATEARGYVLCDRGTFYAYALGAEVRTDLQILVEGDPLLVNPYGVIAVDPARHPHVNHEWALTFIEWLTSPRTQQAIADFKVGGKTLFHPALEMVRS